MRIILGMASKKFSRNQPTLLNISLSMYNPCRQKNNKLPTPPHLFDVSICAAAFFSLHNKDTFAICRQARPSAIGTWMDCCWSGHMFAHYLDGGGGKAAARRGVVAMQRWSLCQPTHARMFEAGTRLLTTFVFKA